MRGEQVAEASEAAEIVPVARATGAERDRAGARVRRGLGAVLAGGLGEALWLFVTLRVVFSLFALMASVRSRLPAPCTSGERAPTLHATGLDFQLLGVWQRWDGCWYEKVAAVGYRPGDPSVAFFPLYPFLMRAVGFLLGNNFTLGGLVVSGLAYIAAMAGLYRLVRDDFDEEVAGRTILYLSVFPSAFFLFAPFTESLFLALAVWTLYAARRGAWGWAGVTALLIGLTRAQGCILVLPLAWEFVRQWRAGRRHLLSAFVPLLPLHSFFMFITYSQAVAGWTSFQAQSRTWGSNYRFPWTAIAISWQHIRRRSDVIEALNLALLLLFAVMLIAGLRRLPFSYTLYAAPQLLLIGTRQMFFSPLMSTSRYVLVLFPVFILLALLGQHRRLHHSWLIGSLLLLAFLLHAFLSGTFVA